MSPGKVVLVVFILFVSLFASNSFAAEDRYVRLRSVEGEVTIYPSDSDRPNEATVNTPILDNDEIQTGNGRAELSFRNGVVVRIGDYSGLRVESTYSPMRINLIQGTVFIDSHLIDRFRDELELRAGDAQVYLIDEGNIRVDLGSEGSVRVTTLEGQAEVRANGQRVLLDPGERTYVDPGSGPGRPEEFYGQNDDLDEWNQSRVENYAQAGYGNGYGDEYLDENLYYDGYDLSSYGDWRNSGTYGNVWVPHVGYGWRPYFDGRWIFCNGGWFWVSYEPWGWAPYHYGRWGWGADLGWYWIPGNTFAASWVSWYSYGDYVGWCPLGYYNRPIYYPDYHYDGHYNNLPSIQKPKTLGAQDSWTFVKKDDLGIRSIKQAVLTPSQVKNIKIDKNQLLLSPKKELVSYVIPKTQLSPALVNDKRLIKQREDVKNPLGIKNKEEQFERPIARTSRDKDNAKSKDEIRGHNATTLPKPKSSSTWNRNDNPANDRDKTVNKPKQSSKPKEYSKPQQFNKPQQYNKPSYDKSKNSDRDWQFRRNESNSQKHYSPFLNPYYKGRPTEEQDPRNFDPRDLDSMRYYDPRNPDYDPRIRDDNDPRKTESNDRYQDVNPKYRDEAKKYFERFDHKTRPDVDRPESSSRSYQAPKRDYKSPESHRPDSRGNSNNNNSKSSRSNSNNNKPNKPHN